MSSFPVGHDPLKASDWPVFDEIGWADYWSIQDWVTWHRAMDSSLGRTTANSRFVQAWGQDSLTHSAPLSARSFDSSFREYAKSVGLLGMLYGEGLAVLAKPLGIVSDVGDAVASVGDGVKVAGVWLGYVLPIAALILFYLYARRAAIPAVVALPFQK